MLDIPAGYKIGEAERGYLQRLEDFQRRDVPLTPSDFARVVGVADTTSFKRFRVLKQALNEYGWQTRPDRMRGSRPSLLQKVEIGPDPRVERLEAEIQRLQAELSEATRLVAVIADRDEEIAVLRGLLMATLTHFASSDMSRAREIERKLAELVREHMPSAAIPSPGEESMVDDLSARRGR
jgi:hypothetical protein